MKKETQGGILLGALAAMAYTTPGYGSRKRQRAGEAPKDKKTRKRRKKNRTARASRRRNRK